jgi:hypothetical protein
VCDPAAHPAPAPAAAQDELGTADTFRLGGLIDQLALLGRGPELEHLIPQHGRPS